MNEYFFVINPTAGGGRVVKLWSDQIKPLLDEYNIQYEFEFTTHPQHAIEITMTQIEAGYHIICSIGGDGTANEVLNGIMKAEKKGVFAAFTVGTGNDIPSTFGIPEEDIETSIRCLVEGQDKTFDVGYCETADRYFGGIASMGFDAEVADRTNKGSKRFSGTQNYQIALLKTIFKFKPYDIVIKANDELIVEGKKMLVAIGNGKRYGGGMHICPAADVTDGKFTGTLVNKTGRITLLRIFPKVYSGKHITHKIVDTFEGSKIHVDSPKKKCLYQVDGEIMGYLPETFITKPKALTVRVPDPWISYSDIWKTKLDEKSKN
ncbi:MAG: diacylglycerol/lipid kinase family protein [Candidatus Hodarchaeota archaeon]